MSKIIVNLLLALMLFGCSTEQEGPDAVETGLRGTPGWLELHNLSLHRDTEAVSPKGVYVKGHIDDEHRFTPTSSVIGTALSEPPERGTTRGWVELSNQQFHAMQEAATPQEPYVEGVTAEDGKFYPDKSYKIIGGPAQ